MRNMRDFINEAEEKGLCKRITAEVDWNLELSHIAKLNEEQSGPALLFENVKDYEAAESHKEPKSRPDIIPASRNAVRQG